MTDPPPSTADDRHPTPRVTVAIPTCCDRDEYLEQAVQSVISQTIRDIEIFVSNDGSSGATRAVVESFDDDRIRFVDLPPPGGLHANLNACLRFGSAPYVAICQDDDVWLPENLERLLGMAEPRPNMVLVHGAFRWIDERGKVLKEWSTWGAPRQDTVHTGEEFIMRSMRSINRVNMSSVMMLRRPLEHERFDPADDTLCDTGLWMRLARRGEVGFVADPLSSLRIHSDTVSVRAGTNDAVMRGRTLREIELAQRAKRRFLDQAGYRGKTRRAHLRASRKWVRAELLRLVAERTAPTRSPLATLTWLARATAVEWSLAPSLRAWRVLVASLAGAPARRVAENLRQARRSRQ